MSKTIGKVSIIPLLNIPLVQAGDDLVGIVIDSLAASGEKLQDNDILVLTQKIVSKAEGRVVALRGVIPSPEALELAREVGKDPRLVHLILKESKRVVRKSYGVLIMEHRSGWVCADAGIDHSNVPEGSVTLLPADPDKTAEAIRELIEERLKVQVAVVITDSHGRPFRNGSVGVALGCAGMPALLSLIGREDLYHYKLRSKQAALADQVASAAILVMGESDEGVPAAVVRGLAFPGKNGPASDLLRPEARDLFR